jgi:hypothetical protein
VGKFFTASGRALHGRRQGRRLSTLLAVEGRAQLNTAGLTFFNLDWANRSAATLTCTSCGRIEWYLTDPKKSVEHSADAWRPDERSA